MKTVCLIGMCLAATGLFAAAPGRMISGDYLMTVDGEPVEVVRVPMPETSGGGIANRLDWQPYSYATFVATGTVEVCVRSGFLDLSKTVILPGSKGVRAISRSANEVAFQMTPPMTLVLEPKGRHRALVVSANADGGGAPSLPSAAARVRSFAPGLHRAGEIALGDDETLYLAPGAWVEGWLRARGTNITVCGAGVLSGACYDWRRGPHNEKGVNLSGTLSNLSGENITVRDVTFFSSWGWTLVFNGVTNALVDNVKIICGRVINDDGIDVCSAKDVVLRNSFIRCQDDCVTPKWWCENLVCTNMTLWTDAANAFRTGYECEPGETGLVYRNLLFRDIDVLHLALNKRSPRDYWANCAIYIQPAHGQLMADTVYEDIRFHECGPRDVFLNVKTMPISQGSDRCKTDEAGILKGLTLRNIHLPESQGGMCVNLSAHDEAHPIEGVLFENVTGYGPVTKSGKVELAGVAEGGGTPSLPAEPVSIAFPRSGQTFPSISRIYVIGAVSPDVTNLVVTGRDGVPPTSECLTVHPHRTGAWSAYVPVREGENRLTAVASGPKGTVTRAVSFRVAPRERTYAKLPYAKDAPRKARTAKAPAETLIFLDAGHGGADTGAVSPHGWFEKTANLTLAKGVADELRARGYKVVLTREDDHAIDLYERAREAHERDADAFVSLHHNAPAADADPTTRHSSVYCWNDLGDPLARAIAERLAKTHEGLFPSKGVLRANFAVTRSPEIPSCLVEADFITAPMGEEAVFDPNVARVRAAAIAQGIDDWRTGRGTAGK